MWLTDWDYRKGIYLTGQPGAGTNYQIPILVGESSGSATHDIHVEGKSDLFPSGTNVSGDLRFTSSDGETVLDCWVESVSGVTPNRVARVWVEVADSLETDTHIYCYYGGGGAAANVSNGDDTFLFFDDFTGTLSDKWTTLTGTAAIVSNELRLGSSSDNRIITKNFSSNQCRIKAKHKLDSSLRSLISLSSENSDSHYKAILYEDTGKFSVGYDGGSQKFYSSVGPVTHSTWYLWELTSDSTSKIYQSKAWLNNVYIGQHSSFWNTANDAKPIQIIKWNSGYSYTDWIFASKYATVEPSISKVGEENENIITFNEQNNITDATIEIYSDSERTTEIDNSPFTTGEYGNKGGDVEFQDDALDFDGSDDYIQIPDHTSLRFGTGDFAISFWDYPTSSVDNDNVRIDKGGVSGSGSIYLYENSPVGSYRLRINGSDVTQVDVAITLNTWSFITIVRDGDNILFYKNGELGTTKSGWGSVNINSTGDLFFGAEGDTTPNRRFFDGLIKYARIYNRALTEEEIKDTYKAERLAPTNGLVGYWKLDEGTGTTATDSAGSNNGTIEGATWVDAPALPFSTLADVDYAIHKFFRDSNFEACRANAIRAVLIAGGGGGADTGSGGGAGGVIHESSLSILKQVHEIVLGEGGLGGVRSVSNDGTNGGNTTGFGETAIGGGGGITHGQATGQDGGSGGGGAVIKSAPTSTAGQGTAGQGNDGGAGYVDAGWVGVCGGGGGAGSAGVDGGNSAGKGNGGSGVDLSAHFGSGVGVSGVFAGGGGGGEVNSNYVGTGGTGGGGSAVKDSYGRAARIHTGSGGAGGSFTGSGYSVGGKGGVGIVLVKCLISDFLEGKSSISLPDGTYYYTISKDGYASQQGSFTVDEADSSINFTLSSGETIEVNETLVLDDNSQIPFANQIHVNELIYLSDNSQLISPEYININEEIVLSDSSTLIVPTQYAKRILSYNPLIILSGEGIIELVHIDITDPDNPVATNYNVSGITNAKDITLNETTDYFYLCGANGIIVQIEKENLNNQTIIDTIDADNFLFTDSLDGFFKTFASTDDISGEIITIDDSTIETLNTDIRWSQQIFNNISCFINTILGKSVACDVRYVSETKSSILTDIRWLKYSYTDVTQQPINFSNIQLKINDVDLTVLNDVDLKSIIITHNKDDYSTAFFSLYRRHDNPNQDNQGNASEITNHNTVKIYINSNLEFDGTIQGFTANSGNETIIVSARMNEPLSNKQTKSIPLASVGENINLYHCLLNSIDISNPLLDTQAVIINNNGLYWSGSEWVGDLDESLVFTSHANAESYINSNLSKYSSQDVRATNYNDTPDYYKGVQVNLGTQITQQVARFTSLQGISALAEKLEEGSFTPKQNWTYFWFASFENFVTGTKATDLRYLGTSLGGLTTDTWKINGTSYKYQKRLANIESDLGWHYVGEAPFKEVAVKNGKLITVDRWEDKNDGLYRVKDESYDYVQYAKDIAALEYSKLKTINDEVLPITSAQMEMTLDGYYYYNLKLLTRLNLSNTTSSGVYSNSNGFPVAIKTITISTSNMIVSLQCDNQLSLEEMQEIDRNYPDINSDEYINLEESVLNHRKFDPNKWGYL